MQAGIRPNLFGRNGMPPREDRNESLYHLRVLQFHGVKQTLPYSDCFSCRISTVLKWLLYHFQ